MEKKAFKIHFLEHASWVEPGVYVSWAEKHGYQCTFTRVWKYDDLPTTVDADMLIVLGGPQNPASTKEEYDYFDVEAEKKLIALYAARGRIIVGSCLGAQLLGEAMGATFFHSPYPEIGHVRGSLTPEGKKDPFLKDFPNNFEMGGWHFDMPGLTHNAEVLAYSDGCPHQIVRYDKFLYGFQTHMEMNREFVVKALRVYGSPLKFEGPYIQNEDELLNYDYSEMNRLLESFLDRIVEEYNKK